MKSSDNEQTYNVSSVTAEVGDEGAKKRKVSKGKIGVERWYYKPAEYHKLNHAQVEELWQCRERRMVSSSPKMLQIRRTI